MLYTIFISFLFQQIYWENIANKTINMYISVFFGLNYAHLTVFVYSEKKFTKKIKFFLLCSIINLPSPV